jgi:hypothetical protein
MTSTIPFRRRRVAAPGRHALQRLTAAYGRSHDSHVSPLVGCYLCLHDVPRGRVEARLVAA